MREEKESFRYVGEGQTSLVPVRYRLDSSVKSTGWVDINVISAHYEKVRKERKKEIGGRDAGRSDYSSRDRIKRADR